MNQIRPSFFGVIKLLVFLPSTARFCVDSYTISVERNRFSPAIVATQPSKLKRHVAFVFHPRTHGLTAESRFSTILFGKKPKAAAALESLENLGLLEDDEPMSKKDQIKLQKMQKTNKKAPSSLDLDALDFDEPMSKKDAMKAAKQIDKASKKKADPKAAALAALDLDALEDDEVVSKKDAVKAAKKAAKEGKKPAPALDQGGINGKEQNLTSAQKKALKALEQMEKDEAAAAASAVDNSEPVLLSKKEQKAALKAAQKKEEKMAAKKAKKGKADTANDDETTDLHANIPVVDSEMAEDKKEINNVVEEVTLEERVRKERPPPRIRILETSQPNFSSLRLEDVAITFRNQEVLKGVTWGVQTGDRVGLVGVNGGGKSTQLRILAGELEPTAGDVVKSSKDLRVAILRQEFVDELVSTRTLKEEFMSVFEEENQILIDLKQAEEKLENIDPNDVDEMQDLLDKMKDLQSKADAKSVYSLESRANKIMDVMGFTSEEQKSLVATFSGGWKMRIGLGKVLLNEPNILLLDEPTNHLDLDSVEWLEEFLRNQNIPMVLVSHDREFLDQVCTKIVDIEGGIATEYEGNYSRYLKLKKERMDSWHAAYNAQEKKIKEEKAWISKFKLKQPQAVKQREAKLEKLKNSKDYVQKPPFLGKPFRFRFPDAPRISPEVAEVKGIYHAYESFGTKKTLFEDGNLFIERNDRIAIVGPNGSGKSTLLRILMNMEEPLKGYAKIIGENVICNYFEQNQADVLDLSKTVSEIVQGASHDQSYNELRALMGQFLFKGDAVDKKVVNLSGGEKARLSLCCMMLKPANLLILDEPTNHLDIPAKEMLEEALQNFQGSVVVISHDRYFISKVATTIVAIEDHQLNKYAGDYKFYMDRSSKVKEKVEARYVSGVKRIENAPRIDFAELENKKKSKNFGGKSGAENVTRKNKGIKNAKRIAQ